MGNTYRPRWTAALVVSALFGLMYGAVAAGVVTLFGLLGWGDVPRDLPVMGPVFFVLGTGICVMRMRSRRLTVRDDSLLVERDGLRITLSWADLAEVREQRLGPIRVDDLVFRASDVQPPPNMDITGWRAARLQRIQPALYLSDWRESPIGAACPA